MIPRHRPPFGPFSLIGSSLRGVFNRVSVEQLEREYCENLQVPHAVWLPSARYGITRSIQLATSNDTIVVCPVFNCGAVHHAASETGRVVQYVDCDPSSFLMSCQGNSPTSNGHAVILSEMFGHRFSPEALCHPLVDNAVLRVFDMAMAIPTASDMQRLQANDLAVVSFGLGKSLYAGWGGMAFTKNRKLANDVRTCRDNAIHDFGIAARARCFVKMVARTAAHEPFVYEHLRRLKSSINDPEAQANLSFSNTSHEWRRPPTRFHLGLVTQNLATVPESIDQRIRLAEIYRRKLPAAVVPSETTDASQVGLSHFSIRVPAAVRDDVRASLWSTGIDVGTLFPFPHHLTTAADFPNAIAAASEVLNLPMSCQLRSVDVLGVCKAVTSSIAASTRQPLRKN